MVCWDVDTKRNNTVVEEIREKDGDVSNIIICFLLICYIMAIYKKIQYLKGVKWTALYTVYCQKSKFTFLYI